VDQALAKSAWCGSGAGQIAFWCLQLVLSNQDTADIPEAEDACLLLHLKGVLAALVDVSGVRCVALPESGGSDHSCPSSLSSLFHRGPTKAFLDLLFRMML
jgi:hypothetical protein